MTTRTWLALATGIGGLLSTAATGPLPASRTPLDDSDASLCTPAETPLAVCTIGRKRVSICSQGKTSVYRYGQPGRIELVASDLYWASTGYSGGGELQVTARNKGHSYTLFDRIVRTGFGADGLNHPKADSGLVVRRGAKIVSARQCNLVQPIAAEVRERLPEGGMVEH